MQNEKRHIQASWNPVKKGGGITESYTTWTFGVFLVVLFRLRKIRLIHFNWQYICYDISIICLSLASLFYFSKNVFNDLTTAK